jgi:predicted AlkP superfamily pyrophosphatase or phosphodiesterase
MPANAKLLHIIIDGCRPDGLAQANTPHLDSLWQNGAYSWTAHSVMPSISLPCHTSMFRSIHPQKHGIHNNVYVPTAADFPSILEVANKAGRKTAMFTSWEELRDLAAPSSLDTAYHRRYRPEDENDRHVTEMALPYLTAEQPDLLVVYLGDVDENGHTYGWMSAEYLRRIELADAAVGMLLAALDNSGLRDQYTLLVNSDHGGHDKSHGTNSPEDMTIVWLLNGPGVKQNHPVAMPVTLLDNPPTIAHVLGLNSPSAWDGQPVLEAFA